MSSDTPLDRYFDRLDSGELTKDEQPTAYQLGVIRACRHEIEQLRKERDNLQRVLTEAGIAVMDDGYWFFGDRPEAQKDE